MRVPEFSFLSDTVLIKPDLDYFFMRYFYFELMVNDYFVLSGSIFFGLYIEIRLGALKECLSFGFIGASISRCIEELGKYYVIPFCNLEPKTYGMIYS